MVEWGHQIAAGMNRCSLIEGVYPPEQWDTDAVVRFLFPLNVIRIVRR